MVRAREAEQEPPLIQQTKGPEIEILISSRSPWKMPFLFSERRGIENKDIVTGFKASHDFKDITPNKLMGDLLQMV
jgi:hypothetical protein